MNEVLSSLPALQPNGKPHVGTDNSIIVGLPIDVHG